MAKSDRRHTLLIYARLFSRWRVPALLITLVLLFNAYGRLGRAILTLANVPFALVGGVFGLAIAVFSRYRAAETDDQVRGVV